MYAKGESQHTCKPARRLPTPFRRSRNAPEAASVIILGEGGLPVAKVVKCFTTMSHRTGGKTMSFKHAYGIIPFFCMVVMMLVYHIETMQVNFSMLAGYIHFSFFGARGAKFWIIKAFLKAAVYFTGACCELVSHAPAAETTSTAGAGKAANTAEA